MNELMQKALRELETITGDNCVFIRIFSDKSWNIYAWDECIISNSTPESDEKLETIRLILREAIGSP
jgi:hypothetical protein